VEAYHHLFVFFLVSYALAFIAISLLRLRKAKVPS
jgi:hypothetical protein